MIFNRLFRLKLNITLLSLIQSNIYSSLLFSGNNNFQLNRCSFSRTFSFIFFNTKNLLVKDSTFRKGIRSLIYYDSMRECSKESSFQRFIGCFISGHDIYVNAESNDNYEFESTSFFNDIENDEIITFRTIGRSTLNFNYCCFFNLTSRYGIIIRSFSQCLIKHSTLLNNTAKTLIQCNRYSEEIQYNNISFNNLYTDDHLLSIYSAEDGLTSIINQNLFSYNIGGGNIVCFWNYISPVFRTLLFVNNSCLKSIAHVGTPLNDKREFVITESHFFNNYKYQTSEYVPIFTSDGSDPKIYVTLCQTDSTFPSNITHPEYTYINNIEHVHYSFDSVLVWNFPNYLVVITPPQSEGFICKIDASIPWPTSTPIMTPSFSPTETPSESPSETPSDTVSQSLFATPSESPLASPSASQSANPSKSPSESPLPTFSPQPTFTPLPSETSIDIIITNNIQERETNVGLICGIIIAIVVLTIIIICVTYYLKKKKKLCFRYNNSSPISSIDLLESNPPLLDSNQSELMSGGEDVFSKASHKNVFNYSLVI